MHVAGNEVFVGLNVEPIIGDGILHVATLVDVIPWHDEGERGVALRRIRIPFVGITIKRNILQIIIFRLRIGEGEIGTVANGGCYFVGVEGVGVDDSRIGIDGRCHDTVVNPYMHLVGTAEIGCGRDCLSAVEGVNNDLLDVD